MKDLTLTQEYLICTVNKKGALPGYSQEAAACLVISGLLELEMEGCISIVNKKISRHGKLPEKLNSLKPLYSLVDKKKPVKLQKIIDKYIISYTDKKIRTLMNSVLSPLKEDGTVTPVITGLIIKKERYIPTKEILDQVVEKIRAELLEKGPLTEDIVALTVLLNKAGRLKHYFSKHEQKELKARLAEIKNSEVEKSVRDALNQAEIMLTLLQIVSGL